MIKDLLKVKWDLLDRLCEKWELTYEELSDGSDGEKFDDGIDSINYVLVNSAYSAIFNKVCKLLDDLEDSYEVDDRDEENEGVSITDLTTDESITITSLTELKMLIISKNLDAVFEKASQQFIDFLDNRKDT